MSAEIWIVLLVFASAIAAWAGFIYARRGAPTRAELDTLRDQLTAAQQKAEKVQADVNGHFEQSAVLFGRLANDYRAFLEHFSTSAQALGISESMARELLQRADQPLLGHDADVVDTQPADTRSASADEAADATGDAEPPLIEDVVTATGGDDTGTDTAGEEITATSRPVEVELEPSVQRSEQVEDKQVRQAG